MTVKEYIKDKCLLFILHICCMLFLSGFLHATGYSWEYTLLILICWVLIVMTVLGVSCYRKRKYFRQMEKLLLRVDQRYLLGELMPEPVCLEDSLYRDMIRVSNKSAIEKIRGIKEEKREYREFIESWVHEIKAPLTGISLICENHRGEETRQIAALNQRMEALVELVLYYARSDEVYKDYMIKKTGLQEIVWGVLARNKYDLIQNQVTAEVMCEELVYTDEKWISFILNQLVLNSVKYRKGGGVRIRFYTEKRGRSVCLVTEDDGVGIKEEELSRIFEKGFTGSNGRKNERSTGMGLYLCRVLCEKLGIAISAKSKEGEGTQVRLEFPVGDYYTREDREISNLTEL